MTNDVAFDKFWNDWKTTFPVTTPDSSRTLARAAWYAGRLDLLQDQIAQRAAKRSALAELGV